MSCAVHRLHERQLMLVDHKVFLCKLAEHPLQAGAIGVEMVWTRPVHGGPVRVQVQLWWTTPGAELATVAACVWSHPCLMAQLGDARLPDPLRLVLRWASEHDTDAPELPEFPAPHDLLTPAPAAGWEA